MRKLAIMATAVLATVGAAAIVALGGGAVWAGDAANGEKIYKSKCSSCHGKDLKGNAGMEKMFKLKAGGLNLVGEETQKKSDEELAGIVAAGAGKMPSFKAKMAADDIKAVVGFMRSQSPEAVAKADTAEKAAKPAAKEESATKTEEPAAKTEPAAKADQAPEIILLDKTAKLAPVKFDHKGHADRLGGCADCHEGEKPLFDKKRGAEGMKMADMYAGQQCGACHNGKKSAATGKPVFAAKTGCMKCHKK